MEQLDRIRKSWQTTAAPGTVFPQHLWIQVDNAGGENKNTIVCKMCAYLMDSGMFRSVVLATLQVGHTHEDIDFLFSIMSSHISKMREWDDPRQMAETVQRRMSQHMAQRIEANSVCAGTLDAIRDWTTWLSDFDDVPNKSGIVGIRAVHWFCFLRRRDLPLECAGQVAGPTLGSPTNPNDVMLMCKEFMSDLQLLQPPELMVRAGACAKLQPTGPTTWEARKDIDTQQITRLCNKIERTMPLHIGAATYLRQWMTKPRVTEPAPGSLEIMSLRFGEASAGYEFGKVFGAALQAEARPATAHITMKRRRINGGHFRLTASMPAYVDFRQSHGVTVEEAVAEWNGAQLCLPKKCKKYKNAQCKNAQMRNLKCNM